jgi:nitric oxide reductase subunit B
VAALVGFLFGWTQGRPLLEIPTALDIVVVAGALVFLFNVGMTMIRARNWTAIQGTLLGGLLFLALLYLFGIPFYRNLVIDWYYWWWVIHLWVEGAWELVTAAIFAFILMKITGWTAGRREVAYVEIGAVPLHGRRRHRPPLLLDRRPEVLAVGSAGSSPPSSRCRSSSW